MDLQTVINDPNVSLVDVREPFEFESGTVNGAVNIPLGTVPTRVADFKDMPRPIVLFCRSGGRSGQATAFLQGQGMDGIYNGGSWAMVDAMRVK